MTQTVIARTLTDSLAKLTNDEQKQVKLTVFDLQSNPENPGLKYHRIDRSKDSNFWSVRVNRDLRIVIHKMTGRGGTTTTMVAFVAHHDDAYDWAERRRIDVHPRCVMSTTSKRSSRPSGICFMSPPLGHARSGLCRVSSQRQSFWSTSDTSM